MALLNYTTKIDADKTASEIAKCLSVHGAQAIMTEYDKESRYISSISFRILVGDKPISFRLPCDWRPVYAVLTKGKKNPFSWNEHKRDRWKSEWELQAVRTAWRIVKDWVEAQMALVETNMVKTEQVFLPYAVTRDGQTLSEKILSNPSFLLGSGE